MTLNWFAVGAIVGAIGVMLGAFGAHGLQTRVNEELLGVFEIGVRYQMYHALALIAVAKAKERWPGRWPNASGWLFLVGIFVFSGSLYLMTLTGARWLGAITPIGGLCLVAGWLALAGAALQRPSS
ncbi:MAG: DUF423 domain-containing protein [Gammaproteobacteria bacterium]|nr:DUF423 domain-containing protein [Gammaproteobacteria bacterium]